MPTHGLTLVMLAPVISTRLELHTDTLQYTLLDRQRDQVKQDYNTWHCGRVQCCLQVMGLGSGGVNLKVGLG